MDPLSVTTGVFSLLVVCIRTGTILKDFYDNAAIADTKVKGLLTEVESFTQVLRLMKDTLEQENIKASFQATGHIGNHLNNLVISIGDGQKTLLQLQETVEKVNKSVGLLDGARKHLRLRSAADEIAVYQQQIRSYRDTLQLTLQTVILWNQVTFRESTDKILPNLDDIQHAIRRIALDINARIASLQNVIESKSSDHELHSLNNLKNCVKSAASIVSSASTTLSVDRSDRMSVAYESDFGDCFPSEPGETMLRWISSNTVYEFEEERDTASSLSGPKAASGKSLELVEEDRESDQSDSDGELEAEIIQSLLRRGKDKLASQEFEAAERHFRNCLTRAASNGSNVSPHRLHGSKSEIMTLLLVTYRHQEKWDEARSLLTEKIALESRGSSKANQGVLADTLVLVEVLLKKCAYAEALLYGRRALKSYRKLGPEGTLGVQNSLRLLCQVCKAAGNHDEEDAYGAILSDILQRLPPAAKPTTPTIQEQHDHDLMTSSKMPSLERALSVESLGVQDVNAPDTPRANSSWISSSQSTSNSTSISAKSHRRHSSQSSFGSSGPASPYTAYRSSSTKSQEGLPNVKDPSPSPPEDISTSQSPLSNQVTCDDTSKKTKDEIDSRSPLSTLENTYKQQKEGDGNQVLPTIESTKFVPLVAESDQVSDIQQSKDDAAAAGMPTLATSSLPSPPLKLEPLEHESEPPKEQNYSQVLHTHLTTPVILSPASDQTKNADPKLPVALERIPSRSGPPNNILKQHPGFNFSNLNADHAQSYLEEAAIEYVRAKRGNPPQPVVPKPRVPVPVSDYELLQWVGTHPDFPFVKQPNMAELPAITFSEMLNNQAAVRRKVVISGDVFCGKSALVSVFSKRVFPKIYHSAELEIGVVQEQFGGKSVELGLWDTGGDLNYATFRLQCYPDSRLVMICFAIDSPDSLVNAEELFTAEMKKVHSSAPCMLVGLKKDLRRDPNTIDKLRGTDQYPVTLEEGQACSIRIGALKYMECSAKTGEGVKEVFTAATRLAMLPNEKLKKIPTLRRLFGKK